jgi:hypothetical protein
MRVLVVGAGAVGLVYGLALQRAGAELSFFVKEKYAEEARGGFTMYALNEKPPKRIRLEGAGVITTVDEVRAQKWDQVWLAVSGPALNGPWLPELLGATGDATVVSLQPGLDHKKMVRDLVGDRLVVGLIAFISYQAPLPGEQRFTEEGVAFWLPPRGSPFAGAEARVRPVVDALVKGGCPAEAVPSLDAQATYGAALLQVHVAALDAVGWSWADVRKGDHLALAGAAFREAAAVGAHLLGSKKPAWAMLVRPWLSRLLMFAAPKILPMDLPTYFAYHFTKVGDQTRANLDTWIAAGKAAGLPVTNLEALRGRMAPQATFDPSRTVGQA